MNSNGFGHLRSQEHHRSEPDLIPGSKLDLHAFPAALEGHKKPPSFYTEVSRAASSFPRRGRPICTGSASSTATHAAASLSLGILLPFFVCLHRSSPGRSILNLFLPGFSLAIVPIRQPREEMLLEPEWLRNKHILDEIRIL